MGTMTLFGDLAAVAVLILFVLQKTLKISLFKTVKKLVSPYGYYLVFLISLTSTLGSLFFSEVAKFPPCVLCWYQRIFMYPQPLIIYLSILRDEKVLGPYLLLINIVGGIIAAYHSFLMIAPKLNFINCELGGAVSCTKNFTLYYGYITIPVMSLTAFVMNIILLTVLRSNRKS